MRIADRAWSGRGSYLLRLWALQGDVRFAVDNKH